MTPASVRPHISQPLDVLHQLPPQVVFDGQGVELCGQVVDLLAAQLADARGLVDVEARHQFGADLGADAVEGLQGAGDEAALFEVDAEDEDLGVVSARYTYWLLERCVPW